MISWTEALKDRRPRYGVTVLVTITLADGRKHVSVGYLDKTDQHGDHWKSVGGQDLCSVDAWARLPEPWSK